MGHARSGGTFARLPNGTCAQALAGGGAIGGVLPAQAVKSTAPWRCSRKARNRKCCTAPGSSECFVDDFLGKRLAMKRISIHWLSGLLAMMSGVILLSAQTQ